MGIIRELFRAVTSLAQEQSLHTGVCEVVCQAMLRAPLQLGVEKQMVFVCKSNKEEVKLSLNILQTIYKTAMER